MDTNKKTTFAEGPLRLLLALACLTITVYGMRFAADILNPIFLSLFVVMAVSPMVRWLRKKRVPSWLTLVIMLLIVIGVGLLFVAVLAVSLQQFQDKIPAYSDRLNSTFDSVNSWLAGLGVDTGDTLKDIFSAETVASVGTTVVTSIFGAFSNILLMFLIIIFMISEVFQFPKKLNARYGDDSRFGNAAAAFSRDTRSYLFIRTWLGALTAALVTIIFYALGVDFPLLWGMLFFLLGFIPTVGFIISIIPPFVVTFLEYGIIRAAIVAAVVIAINAVVDNVISPKVVGRGLGLTPLAVFISLVIWAWVFGPVGAIMSVPLTLMVKHLFLENFESTRFLAETLSPPPESHPRQSEKDEAQTTEDTERV